MGLNQKSGLSHLKSSEDAYRRVSNLPVSQVHIAIWYGDDGKPQCEQYDSADDMSLALSETVPRDWPDLILNTYTKYAQTAKEFFVGGR